jgi:hypothetical protein
VSTAHDDYQHDAIPDRNQQHQQAATRGLSPSRHPVESAQESDRTGGRRQSLRVASSVVTPTRPQPGRHVPLVSPINASGAKFYRRRMVPKPNQLLSLVNAMMVELEEHRVKGFGRAAEYGNFGLDDFANGRKTLSPEGLAVRLGLDLPLASACPRPNRARQVLERPSMWPNRPSAPCLHGIRLAGHCRVCRALCRKSCGC